MSWLEIYWIGSLVFVAHSDAGSCINDLALRAFRVPMYEQSTRIGSKPQGACFGADGRQILVNRGGQIRSP